MHRSFEIIGCNAMFNLKKKPSVFSCCSHFVHCWWVFAVHSYWININCIWVFFILLMSLIDLLHFLYRMHRPSTFHFETEQKQSEKLNKQKWRPSAPHSKIHLPTFDCRTCKINELNTENQDYPIWMSKLIQAILSTLFPNVETHFYASSNQKKAKENVKVLQKKFQHLKNLRSLFFFSFFFRIYYHNALEFYEKSEQKKTYSIIHANTLTREYTRHGKLSTQK